jgi:hypothetical protein
MQDTVGDIFVREYTDDIVRPANENYWTELFIENDGILAASSPSSVEKLDEFEIFVVINFTNDT